MSQWKRDPKTGDYVVQNGNIVQDDSLLPSAYTRLKTPRLKWLYAPNSQYGSDFYAVAGTRVLTTLELEKIGNKALKPLVDDGRAISAEVITTGAQRGGVELSARITDNEGNSEVLTFTPLGVK